MGLTNIEHQTDPRRRDFTEIGDVSNATGTHLHNQEPRVPFNTTDGERHAEFIVEIACCRYRRADLLEQLR